MGVVIVPQAIAEELLQRLQQHEAANATYFESVKKGNFSNAWVDNILTDLECPMVRGPIANPAEEKVPAEIIPGNGQANH